MPREQLVELMQTLLKVGLFLPSKVTGYEYTWERELDRLVRITPNVDGSMRIALWPTITTANPLHPRIAGSVMMEMAAKYAEKVNGKVDQHSLIGPCQVQKPDGTAYGMHTIAVYPDRHMDYSLLCAGFQGALILPEDS